jgi:hypothetical protein
MVILYETENQIILCCCCWLLLLCRVCSGRLDRRAARGVVVKAELEGRAREEVGAEIETWADNVVIPGIVT